MIGLCVATATNDPYFSRPIFRKGEEEMEDSVNDLARFPEHVFARGSTKGGKEEEERSRPCIANEGTFVTFDCIARSLSPVLASLLPPLSAGSGDRKKGRKKRSGEKKRKGSGEGNVGWVYVAVVTVVGIDASK